MIENYPLKLEDLPHEIWRDIAGYDGYQVSNCGRVKSFKSGESKILKPSVVHHGYRRVTLRSAGAIKSFAVHRLVAEEFIPNPDGKSEINHRDGDKSNNHVSNLEWCTRAENMRHAADTGLRPSGEDTFNAKLTNEQVEYCRAVYIPYDREFGSRALARKFGVDHKVIIKAVWGDAYRDAGGQITKPQQRHVSPDIRDEIKRLYVKGDSRFGARPLARKFCVTRETIKRIVNE